MYEFDKYSETILVRRAKRGDVKAFAELYSRVYKDLYKFAVYTMKNQQDAEDVVSEAVIAAYENIKKLKKEEAFKNWIFTILANQCKKRLMVKETTEELPEELGVMHHELEEQQDVRTAFHELNEEDRLIVACSVLGGYASDEIGKMLDMNPATVRSRKSRAMEKMRQKLSL